jgi:formate dehydrogenase maturation protein FdhE
MTITRDFNRHGLVEILHGEGEDYPAARASVLTQLRRFEHTKSFAWISKLYESELRVSGSKFELQEWAAAAPQTLG